jgi:hypothetical protein
MVKIMVAPHTLSRPSVLHPSEIYDQLTIMSLEMDKLKLEYQVECLKNSLSMYKELYLKTRGELYGKK